MSLADGRGRWYRWDKKSTLADLLRLDIAKFARSVDLTRREAGVWRWSWDNGQEARIGYSVEPGAGVRLRYTNNKTDALDYLVYTTTTTPNYGGIRHWWLCPACGRRVRVLYGGRRFLCRRCCGVNYYPLQQDGRLLERIDAKLAKIRKRLKANSRIADNLPDRPPKMHFLTYWRLGTEYNRLSLLRYYAIGAEIMDFGKAVGITPKHVVTDVDDLLKAELRKGR